LRSTIRCCTTTIRCCNCNANHVSSHPDCPANPKNRPTQPRSDKNENRQPKTRRIYKEIINTSYADILGNKTTKITQEQGEQDSLTTKELRELKDAIEWLRKSNIIDTIKELKGYLSPTLRQGNPQPHHE